MLSSDFLLKNFHPCSLYPIPCSLLFRQHIVHRNKKLFERIDSITEPMKKVCDAVDEAADFILSLLIKNRLRSCWRFLCGRIARGRRIVLARCIRRCCIHFYRCNILCARNQRCVFLFTNRLRIIPPIAIITNTTFTIIRTV